jgi:hypothetical protein
LAVYSFCSANKAKRKVPDFPTQPSRLSHERLFFRQYEALRVKVLYTGGQKVGGFGGNMQALPMSALWE